MQDFEAHAEALHQAESGLPTGLGGSPLADGQQDSDKLNVAAPSRLPSAFIQAQALALPP
jgi:hypothetical protein